MFPQRRLEVTNKLPPAPQTMLEHSLSKCREAGFAVDSEDFKFIHRAVIDYLANTGEGKRVMLKILKASIAEAAYTKQYYQEGHRGDEEKQLDYRGLVEYKGWIYRGRAVPHDAVDVWDKPDLESCDMCGGLFPRTHCVNTVKTFNNGKEYLENICNHCRLMFDDPKVRDTASRKTCETCVLVNCRYHPNKSAAAASVPSNTTPSHNPLTAKLLECSPQSLNSRYGAL